jgi:hypothetical protein
VLASSEEEGLSKAKAWTLGAPTDRMGVGSLLIVARRSAEERRRRRRGGVITINE